MKQIKIIDENIEGTDLMRIEINHKIMLKTKKQVEEMLKQENGK